MAPPTTDPSDLAMNDLQPTVDTQNDSIPPPTPSEAQVPTPSSATPAATSNIYGAVYSGVPVYEMMCRNVAVMRRRSDSYLNATQILKVAGIDKGRRTKILEKEILSGEHEKVQGGYGKYQGTWYLILQNEKISLFFFPSVLFLSFLFFSLNIYSPFLDMQIFFFP